MDSILSFKPKEYYLWKRKTELVYPWQRQFVNQEFYKHEAKRIEELSKWHHNFLRAAENASLEETSFYVVPVELSSSWRGAIINIGDYNYIGLSGLQNSPQVLLVAILPYTTKRPDDYRLIRIIKSKRKDIFDKKTIKIHPAIFIEEWEYLPSDQIYLDIPYEKKVVQKVIEENLIHNSQVAQSFQAPIISAPYVDGSIGGVSLTAMSASSQFAQELIKSIQMMVPPEYRSLNPPESSRKGTTFQLEEGIKFNLAERPFFSRNMLVGVYDTKYQTLSTEIIRRSMFSGEYSIFSTLNPPSGTVTEVWKELMKNFTATEITMPEDIDTFPKADVDLTRLQGVINEDLWIQIAHTRQINPALNNESEDLLISTINRLKQDFDVLLSGTTKNDIEREHLVRSMLHPISYNLKRIAQSFLDNFTAFIQHPQFERVRSAMERKKGDMRFSVVETEIINHQKSTAREIYEAVKSTDLFKDTHDLQGLLDWLHNRGFVIVDQEKKYAWVGKP
ncbi:hypothetical protein HYU19_02265 [Candidatus Woesearchaeota archaeon]|nr:hypothetical protein [Candidatus Woesearchaeota archaeon]